MDRNKIFAFYTALTNVYKEEEQREDVQKMELSEDGVDDIYAMAMALKLFYIKVTDDKTSDNLDFSYMINRIMHQKAVEEELKTQKDSEESKK